MPNVFEGLCLVYFAKCYEEIVHYKVHVEGDIPLAPRLPRLSYYS